ncbi:hypothetical protein [Aurantimonas sp. VKM B-3413]|uniref:hypothetical protein n=1 Tax=Aurantimonas sp. VKM B-3413 TaxID=2779401 RepID=UPI001E467A82|nr:hypothetical protein [Aurantimonas sp. VKM B-3413]MCB8838601.1 hypothetical protein [Aurantimonas sp. VKM B-3413]
MAIVARLRTASAALFLAATLTGGATAAEPPSELVSLGSDSVPEAVKSAFTCDGDPEATILRRSFRGAVIFTNRCPGNNQNYVENLVHADDETGRGATLLAFPRGRGAPAETAIANVRFFERTGTIGEIAVDTEHEQNAPCRFERMWRLKKNTPTLVFSRWTRDCEVRAGTRWKTVIDKRRRAERAENWD